jgi:hypothetical protein
MTPADEAACIALWVQGERWGFNGCSDTSVL